MIEFIKNNRFKIIIATCFLILTLTFLLIMLLMMPKFTLYKGNITINYKDKYKEYGYKLIVNRRDHTKDVKVSGKVNTNKIGTYKITYSYNRGIINLKKVRIVQVKDLTKPIIELSGQKDTYICPGSEYKEDGYKAIDNYDGDITEKVRVDNEHGNYKYTVIDSSNNKTVMTRKIIEDDIINPTIELEGGNNIFVYQGNSYNDIYSASDNCDGDITSKVEKTGSVDTNTIGKYELNYKVTDKDGNTTTATRIVNVIEKKLGVIYLTFDDGPNEGTTNVILDILKEEGVKATFFVTNKGPDYLIKREYDEGHTVALHTASHDYSILYASDEAYFNDLYSVQDRVRRITGVESKIIRFPGGSSNTVSRRYSVGIMSRITQEVLNRGFKYYDWNISSGDAGSTTSPDGVYYNVVSRLSKDRMNMVLMHDIKWYTRDAIRSIIRYGKENGYSFDRITMDTEMVTQRVNN